MNKHLIFSSVLMKCCLSILNASIEIDSPDLALTFAQERTYILFIHPSLKTFVNNSSVVLGSEFFDFLSNAKDVPELYRLGLVAGLSLSPLQQTEVDALFLRRSGDGFRTDLAAYLAGRFAEAQAALAYHCLQNRTLNGQGASLGVPTAEILKEQTSKLLAHAATHAENPYFQQITAVLTDPKFLEELQNFFHTAAFLKVIQAFSGLLATGFAIKWLTHYVEQRDPHTWEPLLLALPAEIIALAGQVAFARTHQRTLLLAGYTLASFKDKAWAETLDALVQMLLKHCDVTTFEAFLPHPALALKRDLNKEKTSKTPAVRSAAQSQVPSAKDRSSFVR